MKLHYAYREYGINPLLQSHSRRSLVANGSREPRDYLPTRHLIPDPRNLSKDTKFST